eukprot:TRINITY_DN2648_c0_g1_i1.p1 TRINITY_DN2648_c0_g1~~TRINITY_DN2648_c0_g1_i1.p1  ORF type:complete len:192 (+),score=36.36 TRINITY_DN2648_c0_g1_i1:266-841(+)
MSYKIVVIGGGGVGKSAITCQFVNHHFVEAYDPTIEDSYVKQKHVDDEPAHIEILDTAGQEEFSCLKETWLRQGDGFLIAYSITSRQSFMDVDENLNSLKRVRDDDDLIKVPITLFGNKCDLESNREVTTEEGKTLAQSIGATFLEGSAKEKININEVFDSIVRSIRRQREADGPTNKKLVAKKKQTCSIL